MRQRDLDQLSKGQMANFFLAAHGLEMRNHQSNGIGELAYPIQEVQTTLLRVELSADDIKFTRTVAPGTFKKVELVDVTTANVLMVDAANTDTSLTASFTMRIQNCNQTDGVIF